MMSHRRETARAREYHDEYDAARASGGGGAADGASAQTAGGGRRVPATKLQAAPLPHPPDDDDEGEDEWHDADAEYDSFLNDPPTELVDQLAAIALCDDESGTSDDEVGVVESQRSGDGGGSASSARRRRSAAHDADCSDDEFDSGDSDIDGDRAADSEMDVSDDDVEGITDGYGTTQPIHTLPQDLFADSSGFTETVRAVDKEKLGAMIVAAQQRAREIDALTACLCCDEQCTLSFWLFAYPLCWVSGRVAHVPAVFTLAGNIQH